MRATGSESSGASCQGGCDGCCIVPGNGRGADDLRSTCRARYGDRQKFAGAGLAEGRRAPPPARGDHCLLKTITSSKAAPVAPVPLDANVNTLPCPESVRMVVPTTLPPFFKSALTVLPLSRFKDSAS